MPASPWLIVDGYNVIGAGRPLSALSAEELDDERERLVSRVAGFAAGSFRAVVVFDAASNPSSDGTPRHVAGVAVVFTKAGRTADETIESLARRARMRGEKITVVTSDAATQWTVIGEGALRMSSREFLAAMSEHEAYGEAHRLEGSRRSKLQDRIDERTRDLLARWARGSR